MLRERRSAEEFVSEGTAGPNHHFLLHREVGTVIKRHTGTLKPHLKGLRSGCNNVYQILLEYKTIGKGCVLR